MKTQNKQGFLAAKHPNFVKGAVSADSIVWIREKEEKEEENENEKGGGGGGGGGGGVTGAAQRIAGGGKGRVARFGERFLFLLSCFLFFQPSLTCPFP